MPRPLAFRFAFHVPVFTEVSIVDEKEIFFGKLKDLDLLA